MSINKLYFENNLAEMGASFKIIMGLLGIGQGENAVDHGHDPLPANHGPDRFLDGLGDHGLGGGGLRAQGGSRHDQPL